LRKQRPSHMDLLSMPIDESESYITSPFPIDEPRPDDAITTVGESEATSLISKIETILGEEINDRIIAYNGRSLVYTSSDNTVTKIHYPPKASAMNAEAQLLKELNQVNDLYPKLKQVKTINGLTLIEMERIYAVDKLTISAREFQQFADNLIASTEDIYQQDFCISDWGIDFLDVTIIRGVRRPANCILTQNGFRLIDATDVIKRTDTEDRMFDHLVIQSRKNRMLALSKY
jgi:hypothetical protein